MNKITAIFISFLLYVPIIAQNLHTLSLDDCLNIARTKSFQMKNLKENLHIAELQLKAAVNSFRTNVDLNLTAPDYSETISSLQDSTGINYFTVKQAVYSGDLRINQPLPTDGSIYLSTGIYHIQDPPHICTLYH